MMLQQMCQEVRQWQLVGDFNPSEKYAGQIGNLAQFSGCNIPKILGKFHHKKKTCGRMQLRSPSSPPYLEDHPS